MKISLRSRFATLVWPRMRPFVLFASFILIALCAAAGLGAHEILASFEQVEAAVTEQQTLQTYRAFQADLKQLANSNRDYAEWDDAVDFARGGGSRFISTNFVPDTLNVMRVDLAWIVDRDGHELYSGMTDRSYRPIASPAPAEILKELRPFIDDPSPMPSAQLIHTSRGLAEVSVLEIKRTDRSEPTGARMLFLRLLEAADVRYLEDATHLPVSVIDLTGSASPALPAPVRAWLRQDSGGELTYVRSADSDWIEGYALVRDTEQRPVALLTTRSERNIYGRGYRMTWLILAGGVGLFIACGFAVLWLMVRLQRSFEARRSVELRYRNIAAQLRDPIALVDGETLGFLDGNDAALRALGCDRRGLRSERVQALFPDIAETVLADASGKPGSRAVIESRARGEGGRWTDSEITITCLDLDDRRFLTLVGHDISHRKQAEERERQNRRQLTELAERDALTGLPNRLYLVDQLPGILHKMSGRDEILALLYLDVDHFKNINDSFGHASGDRLLQTIASRLGAALSAEDLLARMGGDEFVVVAPFLPDLAAVNALTERLQKAVSAPIEIDHGTVTVTASIGLALVPHDGRDPKTLFKRADIALYQAKDAGRNCHRFFSPDMAARVTEHVALEQALRHALGTDQIFMVYQPIVHLHTEALISLEALIRWRHPQHGLIPPTKFIAVAEKSGLIADLGKQVLTLVISQLREWKDAGLALVPVAVNVSPVQFDRTDFPALVRDLCKEAKVDPRWLKFEITESALMREPAKLAQMLQSLRSLGSEVLIDDFGTGYSSLSYLNRLPIDTIKIDRAFVQGLGKVRAQTPIVDAVIDMAKKLGLTTVAEGVETEGQAVILRAQGCDFAQGYHFGRPASATHCRSLLAKQDPEEIEAQEPRSAVG
jgi:diguanylate cyclase (GGDEF)-like protein/PAS domain S-box-containing protein